MIRLNSSKSHVRENPKYFQRERAAPHSGGADQISRGHEHSGGAFEEVRWGVHGVPVGAPKCRKNVDESL